MICKINLHITTLRLDDTTKHTLQETDKFEVYFKDAEETDENIVILEYVVSNKEDKRSSFSLSSNVAAYRRNYYN